MPPKKAPSPPPEEEQEEEPPDEEPVPTGPYVPVHAPKNPLLFPAREQGFSRPHLRQVLSQPDFRREYFGLPDGQSQVHADPAKGCEEYRQGLSSLLHGLAAQTKKRENAAELRLSTEKANDQMQRDHKAFLQGCRTGNDKHPWTDTDKCVLDFFEKKQKYEQGGSGTCSVNKQLTGIYDVTDPNFKPPHAEANIYGGWTYFKTNARNEQLYEFRDKPWQRTPLHRYSPKELQYKDKLERSIERITRETKHDALCATTGSIRKQNLHETLGEHSCLKRAKPPWTTQAVMTGVVRDKRRPLETHETFGSYDAYKPGDREYESGMEKYIEHPDRAVSHTTGIVVGDELKKNFWRSPSSPLSGSNIRQVKAQELLHANTRGCAGLKPAPPTMKRKVLLKGTGSLSFTHFKDALVQPTFVAMSPADRSGPP